MWKLLGVWSELIDRTRSSILHGHAGPYYEKARAMMGLAFVASVALLVSSILVGWWGRETPLPEHYLYSSTKVEPLRVLNSPSLSIKKLERWSIRSVRQAFTVSFFDADAILEESRDNFTDLGWAAFKDEMLKSKIMDDIKSKRLELTAIPLKGARVVSQNIVATGFSSVYVWKIEIPILLAFTGANKPVYRSYLCTLLIRQVPTTQNVEGVGIAKISLSPYR